MARTLPNSRLVRKKVDAVEAANRATNRASDIDQMLKADQVDDQPVERFPNRFRTDTAGPKN